VVQFFWEPLSQPCVVSSCDFRFNDIPSPKQGCGARTQISGWSYLNLGSGSNILKFLPLALEWFGPLNTKNHCTICTTCLPHEFCPWNRNLNFRLRLWIHLKIFGSNFGSSHPKLLGLWLHSPVYKYRNGQSGHPNQLKWFLTMKQYFQPSFHFI